MTLIELPDQEAAVLRARRAADRGLTLEAWLKNLADEESVAAAPARHEAMERILQLHRRVKPDPEAWTVHDYLNRDRHRLPRSSPMPL